MTLRIDRATAKADVVTVLERHGPVSGREVERLSGYSWHVVRPILHELAAEGRHVITRYHRPRRPDVPDHLRHLGTTALAAALGCSVRTAQRRRNPRASTE